MKKSILALLLFCGLCAGQSSDRGTRIDTLGVFEKISLCQLQEDPAAFNHKKVEVSAFVSHGFENSSIFESGCGEMYSGIWMEYGGTASTATVYCCGFTPKKTRPSVLTVERVRLPLVENENFNLLNTLLRKDHGRTARATLRGTLFSGKQTTYPGGRTFWGGYGHMGCCSLFVIPEVVSVLPHDIEGLDYASSLDQPDPEKEGCGNYRIIDREDWKTVLGRQRQVDNGTDTWRSDSPERVASEALSKLLLMDENARKLEETRKTPGRIIYYWRPTGRKSVRYMIVVNRPYELSLQAKDPANTIWTIAQMYSVCE